MPDVWRSQGNLDSQTADQPPAGGPAGRQSVPAGDEQPEAREEGQEVDEEAETPASPKKCRQELGADQGSYSEQCYRCYHRVQTENKIDRNGVELQFLRPRFPVGIEHGRCPVNVDLVVGALKGEIRLRTGSVAARGDNDSWRHAAVCLWNLFTAGTGGKYQLPIKKIPHRIFL